MKIDILRFIHLAKLTPEEKAALREVLGGPPETAPICGEESQPSLNKAQNCEAENRETQALIVLAGATAAPRVWSQTFDHGLWLSKLLAFAVLSLRA